MLRTVLSTRWGCGHVSQLSCRPCHSSFTRAAFHHPFYLISKKSKQEETPSFGNCRGRFRLHAASSSSSPNSHELNTNKDDSKTAPSSSSSSLLTLPTLLTLGRVVAIPALVLLWFLPSPWSPSACTALFLAASLTDWLDGYLARKMKLSSAFGAFLDPVADKLMVAAVLILLSTQPLTAPLSLFDHNTWLVPSASLAIIGREITMSALREWAATLGSQARGAVAVSNLGKVKTAAQMASLTILLALRDHTLCSSLPGNALPILSVLGPVLLVIASWLSVHSLVIYMKALWPYFHQT